MVHEVEMVPTVALWEVKELKHKAMYRSLKVPKSRFSSDKPDQMEAQQVPVVVVAAL
jgi:hypothetical protein